MTPDQTYKAFLNLLHHYPTVSDVRTALAGLPSQDFQALIIKLAKEKQKIRQAYEAARELARALTGDEEIGLAIHRQYRQDDEDINYLLKLVGLVKREREKGDQLTEKLFFS